MNTDCSRCLFYKDACSFNIPQLINNHYNVVKNNNSNSDYIENYSCSYAFSKDQYEKNKENLPENMVEFMRIANKLHYYLIISADELTDKEIIDMYEEKIKSLHTQPIKLSLISRIMNKNQIKNLIDYLREEAKEIDWKIHNLTIQQDDEQKLFDILNINVVKNVKNIWYVHSKSLDSLKDDLNYINFLSKVLKPKYPAIRKNDTDLDGLFISSDNLQLIKNEHEDKYVNFLQNNQTLVRKYYE